MNPQGGPAGTPPVDLNQLVMAALRWAGSPVAGRLAGSFWPAAVLASFFRLPFCPNPSGSAICSSMDQGELALLRCPELARRKADGGPRNKWRCL